MARDLKSRPNVPPLVWLLCVILAASVVVPTRAERQPIALVLVAGNLSIRDITSSGLPALHEMLRGGSAGLANVRTGRASRDIEQPAAPGMEAGCVSIGAGAMAVGGVEARRAADVGGQIEGIDAAELYRWRTGRLPNEAAVVHTEIVRMQKSNAGAAYGANPGSLGSALRAAGLATAVVGNSDTAGEVHREAVAIAMDGNGVVDFGSVSSAELLRRDPGSPYGVRTDDRALLRKLDSVIGRARFVVVDFGDVRRADAYSFACTDARAAALKRQAVRRLDRLLGALQTRLDPTRDILLVVSPAPATFSDVDQERLTPVLVRGPGFGHGLLGSGSTRRRGVVTLSDVAPTVLAFFRAAAAGRMTGRPMRRLESGDPAAFLLRLNAEANSQSGQMVVMRGGSVLQSTIVVLVTFCALIGVSRRWRGIAAWTALLPIALPLVMLYLALTGAGGTAGVVAPLSALTGGLLFCCRLVFGSASRAFVWLCGALLVSLAVDLIRGGELVSLSMAGYGYAEGARYYGIGNELMGTLLGAALAGVAMVLAGGTIPDRFRGLFAFATLGGAFVLLGAPGLGANTGGAMAALPAAAVVLAVRRGWRPSVRGVLFLFLLALVAAGALLAVDAFRASDAQSHIGRAAGGQLSGLWATAQRKLSLNFMLLETSLWSRLLLLSLTGSALLHWSARRRFGPAFLGREAAAGAAGCLVAVIGAFAFNDSGVVAAACCCVFLWAMLALRLLGAEGAGVRQVRLRQEE